MKCLPNTAKYTLFFKNKARSLWGGYFGFRYLAASSIKTNGPVISYSYNRWKNNTSPLLFEESKFIELFEAADKSKLIAASLLSVDIADVNTSIDSYREGYPYTVKIIFEIFFFFQNLFFHTKFIFIYIDSLC
jgi:hypothetical protein